MTFKYEYEITDLGVAINGLHDYDGSSLDEIVIPDMIDGKPVVSIGDMAFTKIQVVKVKLPNSIQRIGYMAFSGCGIEELSLGKNIVEIADYAFLRNQISQLEIPEKTKTIGDGAFGLNTIKELHFNNGIERIGSTAFMENQLTKVTFPQSLKYIGMSSFKKNKITHLTFGDQLETIDDAAFESNKITEVDLPEGILKIGNQAFDSNPLVKYNLPDKLINIGELAFGGGTQEHYDEVVNEEEFMKKFIHDYLNEEHEDEEIMSSGSLKINNKTYSVSDWDISKGDDICDHYLNVYISDIEKMQEIMRGMLRGINEIQFSLSSTHYGDCQGEGKIVGAGEDGIEITNLASFFETSYQDDNEWDDNESDDDDSDDENGLSEEEIAMYMQYLTDNPGYEDMGADEFKVFVSRFLKIIEEKRSMK